MGIARPVSMGSRALMYIIVTEIPAQGMSGALLKSTRNIFSSLQLRHTLRSPICIICTRLTRTASFISASPFWVLHSIASLLGGESLNRPMEVL